MSPQRPALAAWRQSGQLPGHHACSPRPGSHPPHPVISPETGRLTRAISSSCARAAGKASRQSHGRQIASRLCVWFFRADVQPFAINPFIPSFCKCSPSTPSAPGPCRSQRANRKEAEPLAQKNLQNNEGDGWVSSFPSAETQKEQIGMRAHPVGELKG